MMKKRIGNDITFIWHIYRKSGEEQVPESFTGKDVEVKLMSPLKQPVTIEDVTIATGVVTFTFRGKHQVTLGNYVAVLQENRGEDGMVTLDVVNAVTLVAHSYMEDDGDEGDVIEATSVELDSEIGQDIDAYTKAESDELFVKKIFDEPGVGTTYFSPTGMFSLAYDEHGMQNSSYNALGWSVYDGTDNIQTFRGTIYKGGIGTINSTRVIWEKTATSQIPAATAESNGLMSAADKGKLDALPTNEQLTEELAAKQDTINDLAAIRSGAQAGATSVQPSALAPVATSGSYNSLSDKPDLSTFVTNSVDNLVNYYLKSETYTKTEVQQLIGALQMFHYEIYAELPQSGAGNVLYLIGPTGSGSDKYEEYVYANNDWVKIGDTSIDLSGYVTTEALNTALADYVTSSALSAILANYVNKNEVDDVPTANSKNLVTSGGVYDTTPSMANTDAESDLDISDEDGNVLMRLSDGHIKTKNFNSELYARIISGVDYDSEVVPVTDANAILSYKQHKSIGSFDFDFKWVGACMAANGRIYGITNGNRQVLEINPETDTYCLFGNLSSGSFKWSGCGIGKNGMIYGYPRSANSVLIIDPVTQGVEEVDLGTNYEQNHHYGGCIVGDYMYLAPRTANHILKINLRTWQIERLGENILTDIARYSACIYHPNGYIYFIPEYNAKVLKLNPLNDAITELGSVLQSCSVYGASVAPNNKCIYGFTNRTNGGILKIDVVNNDTISFIHEGTVGTGYYSTELALNGKLYSGVGNGTDVWELDPTNDTVTIVDTISDTVGGDYNEAKCAGGVLAENGSIYLIPAKGRHIYKLEFDGQISRTMPRKVLMSNYFSNY